MYGPRSRVTIALWTARIAPLILISVAGFMTYVVIGRLSVDYLLKKKNAQWMAILILFTYCLLLLPLIASFLRLLYITHYDPPYVPLGKGHIQELGGNSVEERNGVKENLIPPGLENFYKKDIFIADQFGRPKWCSSCANWKPDRAHHCSQSGRCITRMDHFCPWVGGPVGETNFKFFIQFTSYGALYCTYIVTVLAIIVSKYNKGNEKHLDTAILVTLGLASFFLLFSGGMAIHGIRLVSKNLTQVERLGAKKRIYSLAIILPPRAKMNGTNHALKNNIYYPLINYPVETGVNVLTWHPSPPRLSDSEKTIQISDDHSENMKTVNTDVISKVSQADIVNNDLSESSQFSHVSARSESNYLTNDTIGARERESENQGIMNSDLCRRISSSITSQTGDPTSMSQETLANIGSQNSYYRTFAIMTTNEGENPWDLGSRLLNWKTVMGDSIIDWFLPLRRSPCCNHDNSQSQFRFGFAVDKLRSRIGFLETEDNPS
ncbi:Palmitoyltransferase PFA5 [Golovinomyces cichoracearum]|uniref:Palmitoyltransferase n=1 Tax=Golovinomyces cichoracearum TaxID=62708 RepID=A0A420HKX8_9PEZI|nr:Palmitoyltransferase PFA5 [Golovinomyces cichoracearum]